MSSADIRLSLSLFLSSFSPHGRYQPFIRHRRSGVITTSLPPRLLRRSRPFISLRRARICWSGSTSGTCEPRSGLRSSTPDSTGSWSGVTQQFMSTAGREDADGGLLDKTFGAVYWKETGEEEEEGPVRRGGLGLGDDRWQGHLLAQSLDHQCFGLRRERDITF